ncbi:MAG: hypothetical protein F4058_04555 [Rhodothermaceae bacterium]|nr:hypothetical protein [Rhodothermaceae bacterium]MYI84591.1 hypothetical protein [Rhodothermaceae bacterium]
MKIFFWGIILAAPVIGCNSQPESGYATILKEQNARYPAMEAEDWYKLVHQSVFGAGHAIQNVEAARDQLIREWEDLDTVSNETLVEILGPDSMYARVNLRPYKSAGGRSDELFQAFLQTANQRAKPGDGFERYWHSLREAAKKRTIAVSVVALDSLYSTMSVEGLPAIHHSERYSGLYDPAYRVVSCELLREMQHL